MKTIFRIIVFVLLCLFVANSWAADTTYRSMRDTTAFKNKLKTFSSEFASMEAGFTQYKSMKMLKKPVVSSGMFYYKKGNQVRWEYIDPFVYIIIINGTKISIKDETNANQYDMTSNTSFMEMNTKLAALVDGTLLEDHRDFTVSYFENDVSYKIDLKPISSQFKDYFTRISVTFDKTDLSVSGIKMFETGGDFTDLNFHQKQINKPISDERFVIK